jgi:hypothetical protein
MPLINGYGNMMAKLYHYAGIQSGTARVGSGLNRLDNGDFDADVENLLLPMLQYTKGFKNYKEFRKTAEARKAQVDYTT